MAVKQGRKFRASIMVNVVVEVPLQSRTLEEALEEARLLRSDDCITTHGDNLDANISLIGVSSDEWIS